MSSRVSMMVFVCSAALAAGCDGSPVAPKVIPPTVIPSGTIVGVVSENHPAPHEAALSADQLLAGTELTIYIQGKAFHSHAIGLTAGQVQEIAQKKKVSVLSTTDPHSNGTGEHNHTVTFN